jgi:glycosyltransferase involved in cell wall biosynthesis
MKNLSIIVPCYNYEKYIIDNIKKIINKIEKYEINYEIIIINDGSKDNTRKKIQSILNIRNINLLNNNKNKGKSFSIISAISLSKYENIILIDCDLPYFEYFDQVILGIKNNFDLICINRRSRHSVLINKNLTFYQKIRFVLGNFIGKIINFFLKIDTIETETDTQAGLKAFKKYKEFQKIRFFSKKYFFDLELIYHYKKNQKKIMSIPVKYKIAEESSIKIFSLKNVYILYEFIKILIILKFFS